MDPKHMTAREIQDENNRRYRHAQAELRAEVANLNLTSINLKPIPLPPPGRDNCKSDLINRESEYLVCHDGRFYIGHFTQVWFGWSFTGWHAPLQLSSCDAVWEIDLPKIEDTKKRYERLEPADDDWDDDWDDEE